jgi:hypothetical protein
VVGDVVYQNQFSKKYSTVAAAIGPDGARQLTGGNAGASTEYINQLPDPGRRVVREQFADSLQPMWILYTCFAALGLVVMLLIQKKVLTTDHKETTTGLEAEKENAAARKAEKAEKAEKRKSGKNGLGKDVEASGA